MSSLLSWKLRKNRASSKTCKQHTRGGMPKVGIPPHFYFKEVNAY